MQWYPAPVSRLFAKARTSCPGLGLQCSTPDEPDLPSCASLFVHQCPSLWAGAVATRRSPMFCMGIQGHCRWLIPCCCLRTVVHSVGFASVVTAVRTKKQLEPLRAQLDLSVKPSDPACALAG